MSCRIGGANAGLARDEINGEYRGVPVDEYGRSNTFGIHTLFSCKTPWFRAFHFSWLSFFTAFVSWFALAPTLEYQIRDDSNDITIEVAKTSNIISVLGTIFVRFALGPICEAFGPRRPQASLLIFGGVLVCLSATINSATSLYIIRFFIGLIGGAFVPCQYWTTQMFGSRVVGTANAFAGGWGNLGGGFALFFVGTVVKAFLGAGVDETVAWRYAMLIPGGISFCLALPILFFSDDCPQGVWKNRLYNDPTSTATVDPSDVEKGSVSTPKKASHLEVILDYRVWLLAIIYAACFGVELALNNSLSSYLFRYFHAEESVTVFDEETNTTTTYVCKEVETTSDYPKECSLLGTETASQIASLFGLMNLFARALGGIFSDFAFYKMNHRGRLLVLFICLFGQGVMLSIFSRLEDIGVAIAFLIFFSIFVQASEGATFAIVPFVNTGNIGNVAGIVGAGGNIGAVSWSTMFRELDDQSDAYLYLAFIILGIAFTVFITPIQGEYALGCGTTEQPDNESESSEDVGDVVASA